ncbi:Fungalysin metallopeptidase-domain-containing protein, partial [Thamnocephalis sphaerospora]
MALAHLFKQTGLTDEDVRVKSAYTSQHNGVSHIYLRQIVNGLEVLNADINVNVDRHGQIISMGESVRLSARALWGVDENGSDNLMDGSHGLLSPKDALFAFSRHIHQEVAHPDKVKLVAGSTLRGQPTTTLINVPYALSPCPVQPAYLAVDGGRTLRLVWDLQTEMEQSWYHSQVDARTGKVLQLVDWLPDYATHSRVPPAAYRVYPLGTNDPIDGERKLIVDPADETASPLGWHQVDGKHAYNETRGNNVVASENRDGEYGRWRNNYRPHGKDTKDGLTFDFPLSLKQEPDTYVDAAVTNLFYWNNVLHDLYYQYGFTEASGNFQNNNFGRGGQGGDGVIASAQDGSGYNNANFATPPDGGHGKMRMYVWNVIQPYRDGDLEGGIITHEYTHGLSIRLTGGPDNSGCLGWGESGGMGEGWGDFVATILRMRPEHTRETNFAMGEYANGGNGIRRFPYSTNTTTNPETFAWMNRAGYWGVHAKGAVWAEMLYELYWNLVDKHGFTEDWYSASPKHGNTLALQLVIDGMKLQPCRPSFTNARDAILQADAQLTN